MPVRTIRLSYAQIGEVMRSAGVRKKCAQVGDRLAAEVKVVAGEVGMPRLPVTREDGTRPKGRPYSRVTVPLDQEFGTSNVPRLAVLSQALGRIRR